VNLLTRVCSRKIHCF